MPSSLKRFFAAPLFDSEEKNRSARFLNSFSWSAIVLMFLIILSRLVFQPQGGKTPLFTLSLIVLILGIVQALMRLGYVRGASIFLVLSTWGAITFQAWSAEGIHDVVIVAYLVIILLASLLLGWHASLALALMSIGAIWYFAFLEKSGFREISLDAPLHFARDLTVIFILTVGIAYLLITNLDRSLQEARLELKERLRAEEKLQRQADYLAALHQTALGLVNRLELHPLLESILTRACELVGTPHGLLDLVLPDGSALRQELGYGFFAQFKESLTFKNEGATGRVWSTGETVYVHDYAQWEGRISSIALLGIHAVVCLPLKSGDTVIGVLSVVQVEAEKTFTSEQIVLLERFAALASLALDNARLYEQAQNELKERRATEIALRASEARFRKIFHASPVAICTTTLEGILLDANVAYWALSGLEPESALGKSVLELGQYAEKQIHQEFVDRLLHNRSIYTPDYQFELADGAKKSVIAFYELVDLGEKTTILSMFYDISAQREAQAALQASEERFRKVFQTSQMAIAIASLDDGRFIDANEAFWEMSGLHPESALGHNALELGFWDSLEQRQAFVEELRANGSLKNVDYEFPSRDGGTRSTLAFYELISLKDEWCVLAMFYDVTAQKKAQEALRQSEARTRALLNAVPDMIFEISRDGVFLNFIPSSEMRPLLPPDEFLGRNIKEIMPEQIVVQTLFALERALETGQVHAFEYALPPGEEMHFFEARIVSAGENTALVMIRDITQRRWVETEREKLIKELEDKNAELERFTYTVSHDLKSPLITIKGFLGFLEHDSSTGNLERLKSDIKRIADATDKMQTLLSELLELSRVGRLMNPAQHVGFEELAHEAVELVQGRIQSRHIQIKIQEGMTAIFGDRRRLTEALQNLVDNASKFMGDQVEPCIEIGQRGEEDGKPVFFVRDNGIGIGPEHHDRIFGLFNKLDAATEGTGIGLALVKRIVEVHGGRIWVESEAGKGATFCFTLSPSTLS